MTINTQQEALDALADAALGTDSPSEAFIQGYLAGRTAVITDEEVEAMAQHCQRLTWLTLHTTYRSENHA